MPLEKTVLDYLYQREKCLSRMYRIWGERFPQHASLWIDLAQEERQHAHIVEVYRATSKDLLEEVSIEQAVFDCLRNSTKVSCEIFGLVEKHKKSFPLEEALRITFELEVLIDKNLVALSEGVLSSSLKSVCSFLSVETTGHAHKAVKVAKEVGISLSKPRESLQVIYDELSRQYNTQEEALVLDESELKQAFKKVSEVINKPVLDFVVGENYGRVAMRLRKENAELSRAIKVLHEAIAALGLVAQFPTREADEEYGEDELEQQILMANQ